MISLRKLTFLLGLTLMMASAAFAQSGTITVTGTTPEAFSLTNTSGAVLSSTIALGTLTPANSNTVVANTADVRLRSNKAYKLTAQASALLIPAPGATDGGDTITLSDIGFGVRALTLTGANVVNTGSRSETVASGFDMTGGWVTTTNGLTSGFTSTLNNITTATQVLNGTRISTKGNLATDNNFIQVTFGVATLPQFFTPNAGFSTIITLTIASN